MGLSRATIRSASFCSVETLPLTAAKGMPLPWPTRAQRHPNPMAKRARRPSSTIVGYLFDSNSATLEVLPSPKMELHN